LENVWLTPRDGLPPEWIGQSDLHPDFFIQHYYNETVLDFYQGVDPDWEVHYFTLESVREVFPKLARFNHEEPAPIDTPAPAQAAAPAAPPSPRRKRKQTEEVDDFLQRKEPEVIKFLKKLPRGTDKQGAVLKRFEFNLPRSRMRELTKKMRDPEQSYERQSKPK
jgi:hypothetical protein